MKEQERGDPPGAVAGVGDTVRFRQGTRRVLRGKVVSASDLVVTVDTKSGRRYGIFRTDVVEIEKWAKP